MEQIGLNYKNIEVCAINHQVLGQKKFRRIVAYRTKVIGQLTIDHWDGSEYHIILTNDKETPLDIIDFYNHRGCEGEHHFKELDHDLGWRKLPFDTMEMNTIYMYTTTVTYLLFNVFKHYYAAKVAFVKPQMRMKNFTLHFVTLTAKWIKKARQWVLNTYTKKNYQPLWIT